MVKEIFTRTREIINDMKANGEILKEVKVVKKILESLSLKFHDKKTVVEANILRLDDLIN